MTSEYIVFCACGSRDESLKLARAVITDRVAACVNVLPSVTSIYRWLEKIETSEESLLLIKTTAERLPALQARLIELHSYDTPEILAIQVAEGSEKYIYWLRESCAL